MTESSTIQARGETMIPKPIRDLLDLHPGDTVEWEDGASSAIVKKRVTQSAPRAKLVRRGGRTFLTNGRRVTLADIARALESFP